MLLHTKIKQEFETVEPEECNIQPEGSVEQRGLVSTASLDGPWLDPNERASGSQLFPLPPRLLSCDEWSLH